jgi:membrane associated rhomboid family serine protease
MIFPIGDDQVKGGRFPIFSYSFILVNVFVFVLIQIPEPAFTYAYSAIPYEIVHFTDLTAGNFEAPHEPGPTPIFLTLITNIFMHGGWMHLIGNMVFLWVFADNIESTIGWIRFLLFYISGGVIASVCHILSEPNSTIASLGASGAIAACLGAYLVMFPQSKVKMLFFIKIFRIPAFLFLGFWIGQQLFSAYAEFGQETIGGVAWYAHIGGFVFGIVAGVYFRWVYPKMKHVGLEYYPTNRPAYRYNNRGITKYFN